MMPRRNIKIKKNAVLTYFTLSPGSIGIRRVIGHSIFKVNQRKNHQKIFIILVVQVVVDKQAYFRQVI